MVGLSNVEIDDMLVYGKDIHDNDNKLQAALKRIEKTGLIMNKDQSLFRQDRLEYFGHDISRTEKYGRTGPRASKG